MSIIIIGAGFGGLSAAIRLAAAGKEVLVLEASSSAGGKAGEITIDGLSSDTGPSVLTMAEEATELLKLADDADLVQFRTPSPGFRYLYTDGTVLDVHHELHSGFESIEKAKVLIHHPKCDIYIKHEGQTLVDIALSSGLNDVVALLNDKMVMHAFALC